LLTAVPKLPDMEPTQPMQPPEIFLPAIGYRQGESSGKVFGALAGGSGVGKSHTARQLALDSRFGPNELAVIMAEDATATYGSVLPGRNIFPVKTVATAQAVLDQFIKAAKSGKRVPKVLMVDSLSGVVDYQMQEYNRNPMTSEKTGNRDKYAEFGDLGEQIRDFALACRDDAPMDVIWLITTMRPGGQAPEYCVAGKVIPANLTRWTSFTLYMEAKEERVSPEEILKLGPKAEAPHRTIARDDKGAPTGVIINRYFLTMNNGEVQAKGHRNLGVIEKAYLPDVLCKIKGEQK
jgi:hypothetical protein